MKRSLSLALLAMTMAAAGPAWAGDEKAPDQKPVLSGPDKHGIFTGYRGITLPLSGFQLAFLDKGDRVDVLITFEAKMKDGAKEKVTATILQDVVIANIQKPAKLEDKGALELILNPNETQYAALSYFQGELTIAQRAQGDTDMKAMEMASLRKLFR